MAITFVACGAASRLRLKPYIALTHLVATVVACGAASRLRLKRDNSFTVKSGCVVACGAASRLRLKQIASILERRCLCRMWSGFSSEIETIASFTPSLKFTKVACGAASRLRLKR